MKMTVYEGTPEEIAVIARVLRQGPANSVADAPVRDLAAPVTTGPTGSPPTSEKPEELASAEFMSRVIFRRPLSGPSKIVFQKLKDAHPEWVSRDELLAASGYTAQQLAGLMGALGRRTASTEGYVNGASLFQTEWDSEAGAYRYRLSDGAFEALESRALA